MSLQFNEEFALLILVLFLMKLIPIEVHLLVILGDLAIIIIVIYLFKLLQIVIIINNPWPWDNRFSFLDFEMNKNLK